jgi:hypothetical protein
VKTITETFSLPAAPERMWALFLDQDYLRSLYLEELHFIDVTVLEIGESSRRLRMKPRLALPAALQKLVGDNFAYEDHATLDRARGVWTWKMEQPNDPGGKPRKPLVTSHGTIKVEADGEGKSRRTDTVTIEAHVLGLGGVIESTVEKEIRASWTKELAFLRKRLAATGG